VPSLPFQPSANSTIQNLTTLSPFHYHLCPKSPSPIQPNLQICNQSSIIIVLFCPPKPTRNYLKPLHHHHEALP
jgi:hypothetical protein